MHWVLVKYFCTNMDSMYTGETVITLKVISTAGYKFN